MKDIYVNKEVKTVHIKMSFHILDIVKVWQNLTFLGSRQHASIYRNMRALVSLD